MNYSEYFTSKSILDCESFEEIEQNIKETSLLYNKLYELYPDGAIVKVSYVDSYHKENEPVRYRYVNGEDISEFVQGYDIKNGADFVVSPDRNFSIATYGTGYTLKDEPEIYHMVECLLELKFLNPDIISSDLLSEKLEEFDSLIDESNYLKGVFENPNYFFNNASVLKEIRLINHLDINSLIDHADMRKNDLIKDKDTNLIINNKSFKERD